MKLGPETYLGENLRRRRVGGLSVTFTRYVPGSVEPWHVHANPTLFLLAEGGQRDRSTRTDFTQPVFTLVFHPTTEPHAGHIGPSGMLGVNIEFDTDWLDQHQLREQDLGGYRPLDSVWSRLAAFRFLLAMSRSGPCADADLETSVAELIEPLAGSAAPVATAAAPRWLTRVEEFLYAGFRGSIRLRAAAAEGGVHPMHLARVFRRHRGCSVGEYIRALRLAEAGRLVFQGDCSLADAALEAGFSDQAHLCRWFARELRSTPKALCSAGRFLHL